MNPRQIFTEIQNITSLLISKSLCDAQNFPTTFQSGGYTYVSISKLESFSIALRDVTYSEIYDELDKTRTYNMKLLDGALLQYSYCCSKHGLIKHRLAYFPSPRLDTYREIWEMYDKDQLYIDIIKKNVVPFPIRFDFGLAETQYSKSHLTLGQFENCRIPVSAPLSPLMFTRFILDNFYHPAYIRFKDKLWSTTQFGSSLRSTEKDKPFLQLPS